MIDRAGLRLADACAVVLDEGVSDSDLRDTIIATVGREPLREAIRQLREHTRPVDDGHRERLLAATRTVRRFLPLLLDTLEFQATDAGEQVLKALKRIEHKHTLEPNDVAMQIVSRSWRAVGGARARQSQPACAHVLRARGAARQPSPRDVLIRRSNRWPVTVRTSARVAFGDGIPAVSRGGSLSRDRHPRSGREPAAFRRTKIQESSGL